MILLPIHLTFDYEFAVEKFEPRKSEQPDQSSENPVWAGQGSGHADKRAIEIEVKLRALRDAESPAQRASRELRERILRDSAARNGRRLPTPHPFGAQGLVGPKPKFELSGGWLTMFPTEGWTQPLEVNLFSNFDYLQPRYIDEEPNLQSCGIYVGKALQAAAQSGDKLKFRRNQTGSLNYSLTRGSDVILAAGTRTLKEGGAVGVWQEFDERPNPNAGKVREYFQALPVAETIRLPRAYVTVRIQDRLFHLLAGEEAHVDPHFVFLARTNCHPMGLHLMIGYNAPAVYAWGRLSERRTEFTKELVRDAARQLTSPQIRIL
jgi:hypothetical protein